jgi:hypothetical protein
MKKKSQAALEFLTTYAWAFLVILIMIAALAYFGILRPSRLLPDRCNFGSELDCQDYQISATASTVDLKVKNSVGEAIVTESYTITTEGAVALACTGNPALATWGAGEVVTLSWTGCNIVAAGLTAGEKGKADLEIVYHTAKSGPTFKHTVAGSVFTTVN